MLSIQERSSQIFHSYCQKYSLVDEENNLNRAGMRTCASNVLLVALFVIGIVAASGGMSTIAASVTLAVGAVAYLGLQAILENPGKHLFHLQVAGVVALALMTLAVLGFSGVLSNAQIGQGILGVISIQTVIHFGSCVQIAHQQRGAEDPFLD